MTLDAAIGSHPGLLIIGHGSRRSEANDMLMEVANDVRERLGWQSVEAAFLEIARPTISEGFKILVREGCTDIVVHPYFLYPGNHTFADIPNELEKVSHEYPGVRWTVTEPLNIDGRIIDVVLDRIDAALSQDETND